MRRLVLGDIHGAYLALEQVLEAAQFDLENDQLIFLGDVADGWPQTRECIDTLMQIPNRVCLWGNHDQWFWEWLQTGIAEPLWLSQGGNETLASYQIAADADPSEYVPTHHFDYFRSLKPYFISDQNECFVHAGMDPSHPIDIQPFDQLIWDRQLYMRAMEWQSPQEILCPHYAKVFIGHTPTVAKQAVPMNVSNLWLMDQGAGWQGKLSLMDIDTGQYWQSDNVPDFYPNHHGRM